MTEPTEWKGRQRGCLQLTDERTGRRAVAERLTKLMGDHGVVRADEDAWMPRGFGGPEEAELGRTRELVGDPGRRSLLEEDERLELLNWWLAVKPTQSSVPSWDILSTALIDNRDGFLLVEAKAHAGELKKEEAGKPPGQPDNHARIGTCLGDAAKALAGVCPGTWRLDVDSHYQIANRFAWAWKVASMGYPVVLVYLGFLNADEMRPGRPFVDADAWRRCVLDHARGRVPECVWDTRHLVAGTPLIVRLHALLTGAPP